MVSDEGHPDLFGLLTGEVDNVEILAAGDHLGGCRACQDELRQTVVGHALLRRSSRVLATGAPEPTLRPMALPHPRRPWTVLLVAGAALIGLVLGGVVTAAVTEHSTSSRPSSQPLAVARLAPVERGNPAVSGTVKMYGEAGGRTLMRIRTTDLPAIRGGHFYYAWLLDPTTQKMLPLGQVGPHGSSFNVTDATVAAYSAVDISLESDDGDPGHSATSVLRGRY
ncbi:anti-sigma factor [Nocardioides sp. Iso805N]|uniref:anti-sigma factor n=1 Tax=Nocardioides sp. Iso805N TaxID=1283287 RepID=UPI00036173F6|nr:anti-sigma factor [Nocardioides sp. Iso805N]